MNARPVTAAQFIAACEAWKGPYGWQRAVASDLNRAERTIIRYAQGDQTVPDDVREALRLALEQHASLLVRLARQLERD